MFYFHTGVWRRILPNKTSMKNLFVQWRPLIQKNILVWKYIDNFDWHDIFPQVFHADFNNVDYIFLNATASKWGQSKVSFALCHVKRQSNCVESIHRMLQCAIIRWRYAATQIDLYFMLQNTNETLEWPHFEAITDIKKIIIYPNSAWKTEEYSLFSLFGVFCSKQTSFFWIVE